MIDKIKFLYAMENTYYGLLKVMVPIKGLSIDEYDSMFLSNEVMQND